MSPTDDHFMTGSADRTVRLWHLSRPQGLAVLEFPPGHGTPYVVYDQRGLVFAAATSTGKANTIKLHDARNGSFSKFPVEIDPARCSPSTRTTCTRSWTSHPERGVRPARLRRQRHLRLARGRWKAGQDSQGALVRGGQGAGRPQYEVVASACTNAALWIDAGLEPAPVGVVFVARRYGSSLS